MGAQIFAKCHCLSKVGGNMLLLPHFIGTKWGQCPLLWGTAPKSDSKSGQPLSYIHVVSSQPQLLTIFLLFRLSG